MRIGNKEKINVTISPYLKKQADRLVDTEEFSSMSDLVSIALAEFIGKYDREQKEKAARAESVVSEAKNEKAVRIDHVIE